MYSVNMPYNMWKYMSNVKKNHELSSQWENQTDCNFELVSLTSVHLWIMIFLYSTLLLPILELEQ